MYWKMITMCLQTEEEEEESCENKTESVLQCFHVAKGISVGSRTA
jgi:hypothetical protein